MLTQKAYYLKQGVELDEKVALADAFDSFTAYEEVFEFLDRRKLDFAVDGSVEALLNRVLPLLSEGISAANTLYKKTNNPIYQNKAFEWSEKLKSYTLRQAILRNIESSILDNPKSVLRQREFEFREEINQLEQQVIQSADITKKIELADLTNQFTEFVSELKRSKDPIKYSYFLERFDNEVPNLQEVKEDLLDDSTAILQLNLTRNNLLAQIITKHQTNFTEQPTDSLFFVDLQLFAQSLTGEKDFYQPVAERLYETLFASIKTQLPASIKNLIIIPAGKLWEIRFEALLTKKTKELSFAQLPYLVKDYNIGYHYSIGALLQLREAALLRSKPTHLFGGFLVENQPDFDGICSATPLDNSAQMVKNSTQNYFNEGEYILIENTRINQFNEKAPNCAIVQVVAHGCETDDDFFLQFYTDKGLDDYKLTKPELANLPLKSELIVLSSCNTATGKYGYGEGQMSMARTCFYAGANSITASTSFVPDNSCADLFELYYKNLLSHKLNKTTALSEAKRAYLKTKNQHPWHWANSIFIGDPRPLNLSINKLISD